MRSIWKGAISFGLVTIPVKLYAATEQRDIAFRQVHKADGGQIRFRRVCSVDGEEVPYSDVAKGYPLPSGEMIVLTDEDLASLPLATSKTIEVLQFTSAEQVDPIFFAKSYYIEPDATGARLYALLRDALEQSGRVAIVKVALRQRESLAMLRVREGVFVLETMLWPEEVRAADFPFLDGHIEVRPQELKMAGSLIDTTTAGFDPDEYHDDYREALERVIEAKISGNEAVLPGGEPEEAAPAADLMATLRASVEAARGNREKQAGRAPGGGRASGSSTRKAASSGERRASGSSRSKTVGGTGGRATSRSAGSGEGRKATGERSGRKAGLRASGLFWECRGGVAGLSWVSGTEHRAGRRARCLSHPWLSQHRA
jgi:DNA end-binding protein Ku